MMAFYCHWNGCLQYLLATFEAEVTTEPSDVPGVNRTVLEFEPNSWVARMQVSPSHQLHTFTPSTCRPDQKP